MVCFEQFLTEFSALIGHRDRKKAAWTGEVEMLVLGGLCVYVVR
jgi:hypothetical protein